MSPSANGRSALSSARSRVDAASVLAVVAVMAVAGCGGDPAPLPLDPVASTEPGTEPITPAEPVGGDVASVDPGLTSLPLDPVAPVSDVDGSTSASLSGLPVVFGEEWSDATGNLVGLDSECENLSTMVIRPDTGAVIAAIARQGLWTMEAGGEWSAVGAGPTVRARSVIFDPVDPERIWISGPGRGAGIYFSDDGGASFRQLGESFGAGQMSVDFSDPERQALLAVVEGTATVAASVDGGATWTNVSEPLPYDYGEALAPLIIDSTTYLLGSRNGPLAGVFLTEDAGATWTQVFTGGIAGAPLRRSDGSIAWLREYGLGLIVSTDGGRTWTEEEGGGVFWGASSLIELPDGRMATIGLQRVVATADEGRTWRPIGPALPFEPNGLLYSQNEESFFVWQSDCGFEADYPIAPETVMVLGPEVPEDTSVPAT